MSGLTDRLNETMQEIEDIVAHRTSSAIVRGVGRGAVEGFAILEAAMLGGNGQPTLTIDAAMSLPAASEPEPEKAPKRRTKKAAS